MIIKVIYSLLFKDLSGWDSEIKHMNVNYKKQATSGCFLGEYQNYEGFMEFI